MVSVDAKILHSKGVEIQNHAKKLNVAIVAVYNHLKTMHSTWKGQKWSKFAIMCNNCIDVFENTCSYLVTGLPNAIKIEAENYARFEGFSVGDTEGGSLMTLTRLNTEGGSLAMSSKTAEKEKDLQLKIDDAFQNALSELREISNIMHQTSNSWDSDAGIKARANFELSREKIEETITKVKQGLNTTLDDALNQFVQTEKTNVTNADAI